MQAILKSCRSVSQRHRDTAGEGMHPQKQLRTCVLLVPKQRTTDFNPEVYFLTIREVARLRNLSLGYLSVYSVHLLVPRFPLLRKTSIRLD